MLSFLSLNHLHVSGHASRLILSCKERDSESIHVEASQSDELPTKTHLCQIPNETFHLTVCHTSSVPIERWRVVVGQHEIGASGKHIVCKFLRLFDVWFPRLHPHCITEW